MCFAPQPRALFDRVHCQNCSGREALLHFDFEMCFAHLRATAGCNFSSHLPRLLRALRFSEPTLRPFGATTHWKTQCFATLHFRSLWSSFFWLFLFWLFLFSSLRLSILSEVWLLNFLRIKLQGWGVKKGGQRQQWLLYLYTSRYAWGRLERETSGIYTELSVWVLAAACPWEMQVFPACQVTVPRS